MPHIVTSTIPTNVDEWKEQQNNLVCITLAFSYFKTRNSFQYLRDSFKKKGNLAIIVKTTSITVGS